MRSRADDGLCRSKACRGAGHEREGARLDHGAPPELQSAGAADPSTPGAGDGAAEGGDAAGGPVGNTPLTAATGMVLLVLLAIEGVTILSVRQMLTVHVLVGALLLGPVLLKSGSASGSGWRS